MFDYVYYLSFWDDSPLDAVSSSDFLSYIELPDEGFCWLSDNSLRSMLVVDMSNWDDVDILLIES